MNLSQSQEIDMQNMLDCLGRDFYAENEYFTKKLNGKLLVTTRNGSWDLLENEEYDLLRKMNLEVNSSLFSRLEKAGIIITKGNVQNIIKRYAQQYSFFNYSKMMYILSFNRTCNLNCMYCHAEAVPLNTENKSARMRKDIMEKIIKFIASAPFSDIAIEFQGGEPLARFEDIAYFLDAACTEGLAKKNVETIEIVTNLTMMSEDIAKYIIEKNIGLCTSLDGPRELHDKQRQYLGGKGSYDDVVRWVTYFKKQERRFNMIPTITSNSIKYGAKTIIDEYVKWDCKTLLFKPVIELGRAKKNKSLCMSAEEFFDFWKEGIEYLVELNMKGMAIYDRYAQSLIRNILLPYKTYMCARRPCGAATAQLAFADNGDIYACDFGRSMPSTAVGNVQRDTFDDIALKTLPLRTFTQDFQPLCDQCVFNAYCPTCISRNQSVYKDIVPHRPNDFSCKLTKLALTYVFEKMQSKEYREIFTKWVWMNG